MSLVGVALALVFGPSQASALGIAPQWAAIAAAAVVALSAHANGFRAAPRLHIPGAAGVTVPARCLGAPRQVAARGAREVLSTTMVGLSVPGDLVGQPNAYMLDKTNGTNVLTIAVRHSLDVLTYVLGELAGPSAVSDPRRPLIPIHEPGWHTRETAAAQLAPAAPPPAGTPANGNPATTATAPVVAVPSSATSWQEQWDNFLPEYNAPKAMYDAAPDLVASTGNNNAHLQAGYFILAVRSLGLAAGPMTGADFSALDAAFFPAGDQKSFLVVNIGQAGENAWGAAKPKFSYEDVVRTV